MKSRYGSEGDIGQTIDAFVKWGHYFKQDPQAAGNALAESYLRASKYSFNEQPDDKATKAEAYVDGHGRRHSGKVLDEVIQGAIDSAGEREEFVATTAQRQALKELFPALTFDQALRKIVQIDRDAFRDPLATGAIVAAAFGNPVTEPQHERHAPAKKPILAGGLPPPAKRRPLLPVGFCAAIKTSHQQREWRRVPSDF